MNTKSNPNKILLYAGLGASEFNGVSAATTKHADGKTNKTTKQQHNKTTNVNPNAMQAHTCLTFGGGRGGLQIGRFVCSLDSILYGGAADCLLNSTGPSLLKIRETS